jgi:hypothetical protein
LLDARSFYPAPLSLAVSESVPVKRNGSPGGLSRAEARERCFHRLLQPTSLSRAPETHPTPAAIAIHDHRPARLSPRRGRTLRNVRLRVTAPVDAAPRASIRRAGLLSKSSFDPPPRRCRPRAESPSNLWRSLWRLEIRERLSIRCARSFRRASTQRSFRAGEGLPPSRERPAAEAT